MTHAMKKPALERTVLAIAGSLRRDSFNFRLLQAAVDCAPAGMRIDALPGLIDLPLFNEDLEATAAPAAVSRLRAAVAAADGLLIATPEYNQSVPGVLKNAIDWLSRPAPEEVLIGKPIAVMGASSGRWGTRLAQSHLRHVLYAAEALVMPQPSLFIAGAADVFDAYGRLNDERTRTSLTTLLAEYDRWIERLSVVRSA